MNLILYIANAVCFSGSVSRLGSADSSSSVTCTPQESDINTIITCTYVSRVLNTVIMVSPFQMNISLAKSDRQQYRLVGGESQFGYLQSLPIDFWVSNNFLLYSPFVIASNGLSATFTLRVYPVGDSYKVSVNDVCEYELFVFDLVDSIEVVGNVLT